MAYSLEMNGISSGSSLLASCNALSQCCRSLLIYTHNSTVGKSKHVQSKCVHACQFYLQGCHGIRRCQIQILGSVVVIAEHGQMSSQQILILYSLQTMNNTSVCKRVQTCSFLRTHNVYVPKPSELPHFLLPKWGVSFYGVCPSNILTEIEPYKRPDLECYNVSYKSAPCALDTQH